MINTYYTLTAMAVATLFFSGYEAKAEGQPEAPATQIEEQKSDESRSERFEKRGQEMFEKTDSNKDGFLSKEEMEASHRARMEEMFDKTDTDGDGKLSPEELQKGRESMRDRFKRKYQEDRPRPNKPITDKSVE